LVEAALPVQVLPDPFGVARSGIPAVFGHDNPWTVATSAQDASTADSRSPSVIDAWPPVPYLSANPGAELTNGMNTVTPCCGEFMTSCPSGSVVFDRPSVVSAADSRLLNSPSLASAA